MNQQPTAADLLLMDRYCAIQDRLTPDTKHQRHLASEKGTKPKYTASQAALVAEQEQLESSMSVRFGDVHTAWAASQSQGPHAVTHETCPLTGAHRFHRSILCF